MARFAGGLKLYRRGNKYLAAVPPLVKLVSRHPVTCSINDGPEFVVEGTTLCLEERLKIGATKLSLKEQVVGGQEAELNLTLIEEAEWAKEGTGSVKNLGELPRKAVDDFKGVLGCLKAAYSTDAGDCEEMKASWQNVNGGLMIPCVSSQVLAERIRIMSADTKHISATFARQAAWRKIVDEGRLHPAFGSPTIKILWDNFVKKSR